MLTKYQDVETYRPALDLPAEQLGNLANAVAGDTLDNVLAVGNNDGKTLLGCAVNTDETRGRELVNLAPRCTVQVKSDAKAFAPRLVAKTKHRCVVATNLGATSTIGSSTVEVLKDESVDGVDTVVDASGHDKDDECVLFRRAQTQLSRATEQKRTNVHGRASAVRRNKLGVQADGELDALLEVLDRHMGN